VPERPVAPPASLPARPVAPPPSPEDAAARIDAARERLRAKIEPPADDDDDDDDDG